MSEEPIYVNLEFTPNPNSLKFVVNRKLLDRGAANFSDPKKADRSPLAKKIFGVSGVESLLIGLNFVTINKTPDGNWDTLADEVPKTIEHHLQSGEPCFSEDWEFDAPATPTGELSEAAKKVIEILDKEIRPAVAMDGGDIIFHKFEDGVVYLHLQGACSTCPSSIMTLKMGVENRLKESIPEIKEVVQV